MLMAMQRDVSCQYHLKQTMAKSLIPKFFFGAISISSCDADKVGRIFFGECRIRRWAFARCFSVDQVIVAIVFAIAGSGSILEGAGVVAYVRQSKSIEKLEITQ